MTCPVPADMDAALQATPAYDTLLDIRALIHQVAAETETAPLTEALKWGTPAFVPAKRDGTTIRLGASETHAKLFVHCQTTLVGSYQHRFPTEFGYEGNRAVLIPLDQPLNIPALSQVIAMALTYHRAKRSKA